MPSGLFGVPEVEETPEEKEAFRNLVIDEVVEMTRADWNRLRNRLMPVDFRGADRLLAESQMAANEHRKCEKAMAAADQQKREYEAELERLRVEDAIGRVTKAGYWVSSHQPVTSVPGYWIDDKGFFRVDDRTPEERRRRHTMPANDDCNAAGFQAMAAAAKTNQEIEAALERHKVTAECFRGPDPAAADAGAYGVLYGPRQPPPFEKHRPEDSDEPLYPPVTDARYYYKPSSLELPPADMEPIAKVREELRDMLQVVARNPDRDDRAHLLFLVNRISWLGGYLAHMAGEPLNRDFAQETQK